ncbi:hypothetical protein BN1002_02070 [Bacillus sp. B-jedd]|nr:hypothetical protein BN1002_02070 [Bacillus sp. B-jedd]
MVSLFAFINVFLTPVLAIVFCLNLVSIIKKSKTDESTSVNTFWMTISFVLIVWSIAAIVVASS